MMHASGSPTRTGKATHGAEVASKCLAGVRLTHTEHPPRLRLPRHAHEYACMTVVTRGTYVERAGRMESRCGPGTLLIKPAGAVHSNRYSDSGAASTIVQWVDASLDGLPFPNRPWVSHTAAVVRLAERVGHEVVLADPSSPLIVDGLLRAIVGLADREQAERWGGPPRWLRRVEERLHEGLAKSVGLTELALVARVHPDHLSRMFKRHYGLLIGEYRRRLRLRRAAERLRNGERSISRIALETGFYDQSHFTRAFKAEYGMPPGRFRRLHGDVGGT